MLESAVKIWGKLRKNKAKIFLGKKKRKPTSETHTVFHNSVERKK